MSASVTFRVDGLRELGARMRGLSEKVNKRIASSVTGAGAQVVRKQYKANLKSNPSTDSGELEKHVITKKVPRSEAEGLTSAHYVTVKKFTYTSDNTGHKRDTRKSAGFIEFGTVHMPPEPGLRAAAITSAPKAIDVMKSRLADRIEKASK